MNYSDLDFKNKTVSVEFNEDINGFVVESSNGKIAQLRLEIQGKIFDGEQGDAYLVWYTDHDSDLTIPEREVVENVKEFLNGLIFVYRLKKWYRKA